jgi:hypothetical protein
MTSVDRFGPKLSRSPMLIEHHPKHLHKDPIFSFNNVILLRYIHREKLMLKSQGSTKGVEISIFELCAIITVILSHGILGKLILQPKNQILSMSKSLSLRLHENTQE